MSVSVASNVPGYEPALCFVTDGDADKLVEAMMVHLITLSDAAFDSLLTAYKYVLDNLKEQASVWDEVAATAHDDDENGKKTVNPYKTLERQLQAWLHQLPVIGFNSSKYDLNAIKRFFVPLLIRNSDVEQASCFVIKRQNTFMCLSTDKLKFVDICNYLAPGFSYDKYLKVYGCAQQKGHFPYEYMNDLCKLEDRALPPQSAFFSRLTSEGISDTDYAAYQAVWRDNRMTTMRDYLIWYNNRDVEPFLEAIAKQATFYRDRHIEMFKDGISVPGLSLLYLFTDLPPDTNFVNFNRTNSDLHQLVKYNIVGGPAIILHRYHEKDVTSQHPSSGQRTGEANRESPGRRLVRADANCIPISRVFLARLSEVPRRPRGNEPEERQDHGGASGRHEKAHGLPSTSCESDRDVGM